ncbi:MAG: carbon-nitrogen hydrolase family protein [Paracoccus sp. (in: a-proteobacteria)]|uniref:carbon-nitrogen hydrolase family protein n=1 Tax=Paracoccus sp. TaxID=267 RepID=UPI0026DF62F0|nr:carbon-nitrogen hydrolase family protein [Paracoccus sp. (in: a-proteobacteria)]MDO5630563.1 carbon-nitrogen hydrolase family protein [Paracoccus sp. (in: a-proteobacteria)]
MKIAAAAYPLDWFDSFADYQTKLTAWVDDADDADLLVFPEYGAMELASLGGRSVAGDLEQSLHEVARHMPAAAALHERLARERGCHILAASGPVFQGARPVNRAVLFGPDGVIGHQDKQVMTRFERESWNVVGAPGLRLFDTALGRIGVLICYDSEFPLLARALADAGAELLLVPSCTDTVAGFNRVRIGAMARALENQCIVVQSPTVGLCDWSPAVDENRGRAAIYGPPDGLWPETGIVAQGAMDVPGWVFAQADLARVRQSREGGAVLPFRDWPESSHGKVT